MKITGLDHITINVKDLAASKRFYETIFHLQQCGFMDMGDHTLTYYGLPQGVRLELIDYMTAVPAAPGEVTQTGKYRHLCLVSDDLEEIAGRCEAQSVQVSQAPAFNALLGVRNMLLFDPNGVEIEVFEK